MHHACPQGGIRLVSTFTWLDHSDTERQRFLEAIDRFKETESKSSPWPVLT